MKRIALILLLIIVFCTVPFIYAQDTAYYVENSAPVQISLIDQAAFPSGLNTVRGIRANIIYGDLLNVYGIDCGLVQRVSENMNGIEVGAINLTGHTVGIQIGCFANISSAIEGIQIGLFNFTGSSEGIQIGLLNFSKSRVLPLLNFYDK